MIKTQIRYHNHGLNFTVELPFRVQKGDFIDPQSMLMYYKTNADEIYKNEIIRKIDSSYEVDYIGIKADDQGDIAIWVHLKELSK